MKDEEYINWTHVANSRFRNRNLTRPWTLSLMELSITTAKQVEIDADLKVKYMIMMIRMGLNRVDKCC